MESGNHSCSVRSTYARIAWKIPLYNRRRMRNYPTGDAGGGGYAGPYKDVTGKSVRQRPQTRGSNERDVSSSVNPIYFVPDKGGESETRKPFFSRARAPNGDATGDL